MSSNFNVEESIYGIGGLLTAGIGVYQAVNIHRSSQENEDYLHKTELELVKEQHKKELAMAKQTYLLSTFTDIEQYCQELNENLLSSSRDAERDMVDQRNQQFQTILVAATIMLTALIGVMIQGVLAKGCSEFLVIVYAISNAGSLFCLAICILLCIEVCTRVSKFMYKKSQANIEHLSDAMLHTREVMQNVRGENTRNVLNRQVTNAITINNNNVSDSCDDIHCEYQANNNNDSDVEDVVMPAGAQNNSNNDTSKQDQQSTRQSTTKAPHLAQLKAKQNNNTSNNTKSSSGSSNNPGHALHHCDSVQHFEKHRLRHKIATLEDDDVDVEWSKHEKQIQEYFSARDKINERMEALAVANASARDRSTDDPVLAAVANTVRMSFETFWKMKCDHLGNIAIMLFYSGTCLMLIATMVYMYGLFVYQYSNTKGANVGVATIGFSMIICVGFAIYLRYYDHSIAVLREHLDSEDLIEKKGIMKRLFNFLVKTSRRPSTGTADVSGSDEIPSNANYPPRPYNIREPTTSAGAVASRSSGRPNVGGSVNGSHHSGSAISDSRYDAAMGFPVFTSNNHLYKYNKRR